MCWKVLFQQGKTPLITRAKQIRQTWCISQFTCNSFDFICYTFDVGKDALKINIEQKAHVLDVYRRLAKGGDPAI